MPTCPVVRVAHRRPSGLVPENARVAFERAFARGVDVIGLDVHLTRDGELAVRYHLGPLDLAETVGYVRHHVRAADYTTGPLFTDDAVARIYEYTEGLPRRINQICTAKLMAGLIDQKQPLDETTIRKAIAELDHD